MEMENVKPRVAIYLHPWSLIAYDHTIINSRAPKLTPTGTPFTDMV